MKKKRMTKATLKSFVKRHGDNLYIKTKSSFDGMVDCVMPHEDAGFHKIEKTERNLDATLGIEGVWLVNGSRDYFKPYKDDEFTGIEVYNCTGSFILAVKGEDPKIFPVTKTKMEVV